MGEMSALDLLRKSFWPLPQIPGRSLALWCPAVNYPEDLSPLVSRAAGLLAFGAEAKPSKFILLYVFHLLIVY
jgi:hypothetical protein